MWDYRLSGAPWHDYRAPVDGIEGITDIVIGEGVTGTGSSAFYDLTDVRSVTLPNSVTAIGASAFDGNTSLDSLVIPAKVTGIGPYAFARCTGLMSITNRNPKPQDINENVFPASLYGKCRLHVPARFGSGL
jgi:hypothetical protein